MSMNIYEMITNRILEQLEKGVIPWRKSWKGNEPINYITRKPYQGVNLLLLPYGGEYITFKQCKESGGHVKKGEKSNMIVFFKPMEIKDEETDEIKSVPFLQYSNVFHISQCTGIESKLEQIQNNITIEPIKQAQNIIDNYINRSGIKMEHIQGNHSAYYTPASDTITLPTIKQFESGEDYYSTAFHETAHSTGHTSRLNRIAKPAAFGSETYSKEELTAEISACMLMNLTGIEQPKTFINNAAYIQGWSKKLKEDKKAILTASGQAQRAVDYIIG